MKKLFSILLFVALTASQAQDSKIGWLFINENTIALDKQAHGMAGLYLGFAAYGVAYGASGENRKTAKIWGILVPTLVGTLKEVSDIRTTGFDTADLAYTVAGGIVATYAFDFWCNVLKNARLKANIIAMTDRFYE